METLKNLPKTFNPKLDLAWERTVPAPIEVLWKGWTEPEILKQWFCPKPWQVTACELELKPGGHFNTVMAGPKGEKMDNYGSFLIVEPKHRMVWTSALLAGYRPAPVPHVGFHFTAELIFTPKGKDSLYRVVVTHQLEKEQQKHTEMGFPGGWSIALDQLLELAKTTPKLFL